MNPSAKLAGPPWRVLLATSLALITGLPAFAESSANIIDVSDSATLSGAGWSYDSGSGVFTIADGANVTITGTTSTNRVTVASGANATITLNNASITSGAGTPFVLLEDGATGANVQLILSGDNTLTATGNTAWAGLTVEGLASLTIKGTGSLAATGGGTTTVNGSLGGAGIGSGAYGANGGKTLGTISIQSGLITAIGGVNAAGIGSGSVHGQNNMVSTIPTGGVIDISGGTVIARSGALGAAIGGGVGAHISSITISGGNIDALATGEQGAGIGAGRYGDIDTISISGGDVLAVGAKYGAGIGTGYAMNGANATIDTITISGGNVEARSGADDKGWSSAGIGGGVGGANIGAISITGGYVSAVGTAAAIGGGIRSGDLNDIDLIEITGGVVVLGQGSSTSIGLCDNGDGIVIIDGATVIASTSIGQGATSVTIGSTALVFAPTLGSSTTEITGTYVNSTGATYAQTTKILTLAAPVAVPTGAVLIIPQGVTLDAASNAVTGDMSVATTGAVTGLPSYAPDAATTLTVHVQNGSTDPSALTTATATLNGALVLEIPDNAATLADAATLAKSSDLAGKLLGGERVIVKSTAAITGAYTSETLSSNGAGVIPASTVDYITHTAEVTTTLQNEDTELLATWNVAQTLSWNATGDAAHGAFTLADGQAFEVDTPLDDKSGNAGWDGRSLTKKGAGTLTLTGSAANYTGDTNVEAGLLQVSGTFASTGGNIASAASALIDGAWNVSATLTVNGALAATNGVTVLADGILGGTGTITGNVLLNAGGTLAPGNSPGVLTVTGDVTLANDSTSLFEIGGAGAGEFDTLVVISGILTYGGTLELVSWNDYTGAAGDEFQIFDLVSGATSAGAFASVNAFTLAAGLEWDYSRLYTDGIVAIITAAVPEPAAYAALAGLAMLVLYAWLRSGRNTL